MRNSHEGFSAEQGAFANSLEIVAQPDQASTALALHRQLLPVADRIEDVLLRANVLKQQAGTLDESDAIKQRLYIEAANSLIVDPTEVVSNSHSYASRATHFMHLMLGEPHLIADIFEGYEPVSPGFDWSKQFCDAALTDRWEGFIAAALQLEQEGKPRPFTLTELAQAADERGLYRR